MLPGTSHRAVVLVDRPDRAALQAVRYALSLGAEEVVAVHAAVDPDIQDELIARWMDLRVPDRTRAGRVLGPRRREVGRTVRRRPHGTAHGDHRRAATARLRPADRSGYSTTGRAAASRGPSAGTSTWTWRSSPTSSGEGARPLPRRDRRRTWRLRARTKHAKVASRARDHHGLWPGRHPAHAGAVEGRTRDHRDRQERRGVRPAASGIRGPYHRRPRVRPGRARGRRDQGGRRVPRGLERRQLQHRLGARRPRALPRPEGHRADLRPHARGHLREA